MDSLHFEFPGCKIGYGKSYRDITLIRAPHIHLRQLSTDVNLVSKRSPSDQVPSSTQDPKGQRHLGGRARKSKLNRQLCTVIRLRRVFEH